MAPQRSQQPQEWTVAAALAVAAAPARAFDMQAGASWAAQQRCRLQVATGSQPIQPKRRMIAATSPDPNSRPRIVSHSRSGRMAVAPL